MKIKKSLTQQYFFLLRSNQASILLITLWVLSILTIFAISLGYAARTQLHYTRHLYDRLKVHYLARSGVEKSIAVLADSENQIFSALNETWANSEELFKELPIDDGFVTVSYFLDEDDAGQGQKKYTILYGVMDESSRIDINYAPADVMSTLLERIGKVPLNRAEAIAAAIVDWRDENGIVSLGGAENEYYQGLVTPYTCRNGKFQVMQELLLVRGMDQEIFSRIKEAITVYGTVKVNINTAGFDVFYALGLGKNLCKRILEYRRGRDGIAGTKDDNVFKTAGDLRNIGSLFTEESAQINHLISSNMITTKTEIFRINSKGQIKYEKREHAGRIICVVKYCQDKKNQILYWHEE